MLIKKYIYMLLVGVFLPVASMADIGYCFESQLANGKTINLKLSLLGEENKFGFVRYKNGDADIEIKKISEKVISPRRQMPATVQSKWLEQNANKIAGYYYFTTTGANAGELVYVREKDKKHFKFFDDRQNPDLNCGWE